MEAILGVVAWLIQIAGLLLVVAIISYILFKVTKKRSIAVITLCVFLLLECAGLAYLSRNPFFSCPEQYEKFISEEKKEHILSIESGIYSLKIPVVPVCVSVAYADDDRIEVETRYLFFGRLQREYGEEGTSILKELY